MYNNEGDIGQTGKLLSIVTEEYLVCAKGCRILQAHYIQYSMVKPSVF
jgi:hypothetical protein